MAPRHTSRFEGSPRVTFSGPCPFRGGDRRAPRARARWALATLKVVGAHSHATAVRVPEVERVLGARFDRNASLREAVLDPRTCGLVGREGDELHRSRGDRGLVDLSKL